MFSVAIPLVSDTWDAHPHSFSHLRLDWIWLFVLFAVSMLRNSTYCLRPELYPLSQMAITWFLAVHQSGFFFFPRLGSLRKATPLHWQTGKERTRERNSSWKQGYPVDMSLGKGVQCSASNWLARSEVDAILGHQQECQCICEFWHFVSLRWFRKPDTD